MDNKQKHKPVRMCTACRGRFDKDDLLRIVLVAGKLKIDCRHNIIGRGIYLCKNINCLRSAQKKRCFERGFKGVNVGSIYTDIETILMSEGSKIDGK